MDALVVPPPRPRARLKIPARTPAAAGTAAALAAIVALAAVLRGWALARQGFWYDEAITGWLVRTSPGQLLAAIPRTESTPPLYYLIAWVWARIFGYSEAGLRSLSLVAGVGAVPLAFAAARDLSSRRAGLCAALLVAVNPLLVWYSQEARAYSLLVLAAAASFWLFVRARTSPTPTRLAVWAVVSALALCTHYFAVFVVAPEAVMLLVRRGPLLRLRIGLGAFLGAVSAGLAVLAWAQRGHAHWQGSFSLALRARQVPEEVLAGFQPSATHAVLAAIGAAVLVCVALATIRGSRGERRAAAVAAAIGVTAILVPLTLALLGADYLNTRNVIGAVVPLIVAIGICAGARRAGVVGLAATGIIAAVSIGAVRDTVVTADAQRPHWRAVATALAARPGAERAILVRGTGTWAASLALYLPHTWWAARSGVRAREIDVLRKLPVRTSCRGNWWGAVCDIPARPALARPPARGFRFSTERRVAGFAIDRYRALRPVLIYQRQPPLDSPPPRSQAHARRHVLFTPRPRPLIP